MSDCASHRAELDDVAAGAAMSDALASHVCACGACVAELDQTRALVDRIGAAARTWMAVEPPAVLADRILARVRSEHARHVSARPWWVMAAGVAAGAAIAFSFYEVARRAPRSTAVTASTASPLIVWRSPTAGLLQFTQSVLDIRSRGRLLDVPSPPDAGRRSGGNHVG